MGVSLIALVESVAGLALLAVPILVLSAPSSDTPGALSWGIFVSVVPVPIVGILLIGIAYGVSKGRKWGRSWSLGVSMGGAITAVLIAIPFVATGLEVALIGATLVAGIASAMTVLTFWYLRKSDVKDYFA